MNEHEKFRYKLEHEMFPDMLYSQKVNMLNAIIDKGGKFFSDIYLIYSPFAEILYKEDDFKVDAKCCQYDENRRTLYFLVVTMPEPTAADLCKRVYFCYEEKTGIVKYYTSEKTENGTLNMCSWTKHKTHKVYDASPMDEELEFRRIGNMFLKYVSEK